MPDPPDVAGKATIAGLTAAHGDRLKPVEIGPHLLDAIQPMERMAFFRKWNVSVASGPRRHG
ncbi:hypothetical protein [Paenirhodobacter sp.]|uniref:hypothetical protein n=1 Tax=Paenirhodobacter sp. TaxID=1965326 RepID=UPI003B405F26